MSTLELRDAGSGKLLLSGYASVSERWYPVGRAFREKVRRGTWRRMLGEGPDTVLLTDHEGLAYARTKTPSGEPSLRLGETDYGLRVEADLDATAPRVQDLRSTMENCGLQMSVGMLVQDDEWSDEGRKRELKTATVHKGDVTLTNFGANDAASATISEREGLSELERRELSGSRERRMCPDLDGFDLRAGPTLTVARSVPIIASGVEAARAAKARAEAGRAEVSERAGTKYSRADIDRLGQAAKAYKARDGHYAYPVNDHEDVKNAVKALGRSPASERPAIRRFIMARARELKATYLIPSTWHAGGSLSPA